MSIFVNLTKFEMVKENVHNVLLINKFITKNVSIYVILEKSGIISENVYNVHQEMKFIEEAVSDHVTLAIFEPSKENAKENET